MAISLLGVQHTLGSDKRLLSTHRHSTDYGLWANETLLIERIVLVPKMTHLSTVDSIYIIWRGWQRHKIRIAKPLHGQQLTEMPKKPSESFACEKQLEPLVRQTGMATRFFEAIAKVGEKRDNKESWRMCLIGIEAVHDTKTNRARVLTITSINRQKDCKKMTFEQALVWY